MEVESSRERMQRVDKWVHDSSLDHKGNIPLRDATGVWKASFFIILSEFSERLSYYGIASSFIIYLTTVIQQDVKTAARNVNYWSGVTTLTPLLGGFLADSYLGRYYTVFISSVLYLIGLILLTMTWFLPSLKPCGGGSTSVCREPKKIHEVTFFIAMYLISVATGGHKPALESFGADQFDDDNKEERMKKTSFFNWWNCALCCGLFLGVTVIVYIQDHVSWGAADVILAVAMGLSLAVFIIGRPFYRYRVPKGSPLTPMLHVIVAAIRNRNLPHISSPALLYELPRSEMSRTRQLCHTDNIKFLDKAAIVEDRGNLNSATEKPSPWKLTTVTRVEELKLLINMLPIWLTTIPFGLNIAQGSTFYIKQSTLLDRSIGDNIVIPPSSIFTLSVIGMITTISLYEKVLVPILRKSTNNEQGITTLQRIGIGIFLSIASMVVAALVERKRLAVAKENPSKGSISMSVFWLAPQFLVTGIGGLLWWVFRSTFMSKFQIR
ncbi:Protein NRT1/ PTR FAMILY 5.6 [Linum perenne]